MQLARLQKVGALPSISIPQEVIRRSGAAVNIAPGSSCDVLISGCDHVAARESVGSLAAEGESKDTADRAQRFCGNDSSSDKIMKYNWGLSETFDYTNMLPRITGECESSTHTRPSA